MTVIETSKILLECADWHSWRAGVEIVSKNFGAADQHTEWAELLKSIAIPAPLGETDEKLTK